MKAKLLLMLFLVLLGLEAFASKQPEKRLRVRCKANEREVARFPFTPSIEGIDTNSYLYLTFQFPLYNASITISDRNGNEIVKELRTTIYEGKIVTIPNADAYPYYIEIISPTVEIWGEVILEE